MLTWAVRTVLNLDYPGCTHGRGGIAERVYGDPWE